MNVSHAETVNQATKYLRDFTEHIPHTLDGHILDGHTLGGDILDGPPSDVTNKFQPLANVTKSSASDVAGVLESPSELKKTLEKAKCLRCLVIRP